MPSIQTRKHRMVMGHMTAHQEGKIPGKLVKLSKVTDGAAGERRGVIMKYNHDLTGDFPGDNYPLVVLWLNDKKISNYKIAEIELIPESDIR